MLEFRVERRVVTLSLARPVPPGPEGRRLAQALVRACERIAVGDAQPAAVVLTCSPPAFYLTPPTRAEDLDAEADDWARATEAVGALSAPTVAALAGDAVGPAWELALACDLRVAGAGVRVGFPEVGLGRIPAAGGTQRLVRLVGRGAALRMLLLAEVVDASEALARGLVHRVGAPSLEEPLGELIEALRRAAPIALAYTKEAVHGAADLPLDAGLRLEADLAALLQTTADRMEGVQAALARRPAEFRGQ